MITAQQIEHYRTQGYAVVENMVAPETRLRMKQVLAGLVEASRSVSSHDATYDLEPGHSASQPSVRRIKKPHLVDAVFAEFSRSPALLAALSALLGPSGVRLHNSKLNLKAASVGSPVEWHQDWAFYPHTNDDVLAVGVMLDDATLENGPLLVVPGTHTGPTFDHHDSGGYFCGAMDPVNCPLDYAHAVPLIGPAGSVSFHHARLVHGSAQNRSTQSRNLLLYEFAAADAFPLMGISQWDDFNARLLSGAVINTPRVESNPVRMPLPAALRQGSIYENQTQLRNRYFSPEQSWRGKGVEG
jgi:phytanoyl-CoA hydroxylase